MERSVSAVSGRIESSQAVLQVAGSVGHVSDVGRHHGMVSLNHKIAHSAVTKRFSLFFV